MSNKRFRKKAVEVEAIYYDGNTPLDVFNFIGNHHLISYDGSGIWIKIIEGGKQLVTPGEWVLKGYSEKNGYYFWAVKQDYLDEFYEPID